MRQFAERITSIEPQTTRKVALLQALRSSGARQLHVVECWTTYSQASAAISYCHSSALRCGSRDNVEAHDVSCCMDGVEQDIEACGPFYLPARDDEPDQLNRRFLVVFSFLLLRSFSWWSAGARCRAMLRSLDYSFERPPSFIGVMSTTLSSEFGWRRSFTEIVSRPTQQPDSVLSQEFEAFAASERKSSLATFILWDSTGNTLCTTRHYGTWSLNALILHGTRPPASSRCSRFPDVGRHQRDRGSHWYANTWVSCLCVGRNVNLGTGASERDPDTGDI